MFVDKDRPNGRAHLALLAGSNCLKLGYGRFLQTDPLGYDDGLNWYNYVDNDPVNNTDPTGFCGRSGHFVNREGVTEYWTEAPCGGGSGGGGFGGLGGSGGAGSGVGGGGGRGPAPAKQPQNNELPVCQFHPHLSLQFDAGIFAGLGGGFTLGIDIDFNNNSISAFRSFRIGKGLGLTGGLGLGLSNSGPTAGTSSSRNASIGLGVFGVGVSRPVGGGPTSINLGGSLGPKVGIELSKTDNLTYVANITPDVAAETTALCQ